jgi:hypothetical protein
MKVQILDMVPYEFQGPVADSVLSFEPFIQYLRERRDAADCHRSYFFNYVIEQFEAHPELLQPIALTEAVKYTDQLQLIYTTLSSLAEDESTQLWSLCMPIRPVIFFSTNALFDLISGMISRSITNDVIPKDQPEMKRNKLMYSYAFILERCYGIHYNFGHDMVHTLEDGTTGMHRYFRQKNDNRFIRIHHNGPLPELEMVMFRPGYDNSEKVLEMLQEKLPLSSFRFEGIGITSVEEVTPEYALEQIKNMLVNHTSLEADNDYSRFYNSLKILGGSHQLEFGLLPVLLVNNKVVFRDNACHNSILVKIAQEEGKVDLVYERLMDGYFKEPRLMDVPLSPDDDQGSPYLKMLRERGIATCGLVPVFFNQSLVGILEVYCRVAGVLTKDVLLKLDPSMPLLAQLLKNTIDDFNKEIDKVIKEKFTALQPSVQWKFNEVALNYLQQKNGHPGTNETEEIIFDNVYPLYGAVDIRNSTIERNEAMVADLQVQFTVLIDVLKKLKAESGFGLLDEKIFQAEKWLSVIRTTSPFADEIRLNDYLENDITPFLIQLSESRRELGEITKAYFSAIDEKGGVAQENRHQLEKSMSTVISAVNNYFEMLKDEIQKAYPSYFEKFRTDGVEYDIYIGQSITPAIPYSDIYLKNLRLLQLTSMAAISRYTHSLLAELPKKVETTQLIFIHSQPIDIRFRKDEKRFDVEGAYNIRYHIIKKRIDKVRIRNTQERLTQPNKIALVYFSQKEADEYISYIRYLQGENILENDLERLELEELQGVSGLKALRVGVKVI